MMRESIAAIAATVLVIGNAQASLIDRGGGLIYDTDLNITWLQNANYGAGSAYDDSYNSDPALKIDGRMTWAHAMAWAESLVFHDSVRNVDYSDWRLPGKDGGCATYNCTGSEMGHLFFTELGNKAIYGVWPNYYQPDYGLKNVGPFINFKSGVYWSSTPNDHASSFTFYMDAGYQAANSTYYPGVGNYALAVRDGDVASVAAPIPEPSTYAMLLAGLGLLGLTAKRRRQKLTA